MSFAENPAKSRLRALQGWRTRQQFSHPRLGSAAAARVEGFVAGNLKPQRWALGLRVAVAGSAPVRCHGLPILFVFTVYGF